MLRSIRSSNNNANLHKIPLNLVYSHPSIQKLGEYLWGVLSGGLDVEKHARAIQIETRSLEMESLVNKYTAEVPPPNWETAQESCRQEAVLLTGSTGRLGCYILKQLAETEGVVKIYALNRPSATNLSAETRQKDALGTWELRINAMALDKRNERNGLGENRFFRIQSVKR